LHGADCERHKQNGDIIGLIATSKSFIRVIVNSAGKPKALIVNSKGKTMTKYPKLFSTDSAKAAKASGYGYLNAIHYLAPYTLGGAGNLCPNASAACVALCLGHYSGQAAMVSDLENGTNNVRESRKLKAQLFMRDRAEYMNRLARDIIKLDAQATRESLELCVRLNGSSDIVWERISFEIDAKTAKALYLPEYAGRIFTLPQLFPAIQFVEYTKLPGRLGKAPRNLDLTLSYSAENAQDCVDALMAGHNVAMVFAGGLPESFAGFFVIDGDKHDLRHLDQKGGYIVGLSPKGAKAKKDTSGFVVRWLEQSGKDLSEYMQFLREAPYRLPKRSKA